MSGGSLMNHLDITKVVWFIVVVALVTVAVYVLVPSYINVISLTNSNIDVNPRDVVEHDIQIDHDAEKIVETVKAAINYGQWRDGPYSQAVVNSNNYTASIYVNRDDANNIAVCFMEPVTVRQSSRYIAVFAKKKNGNYFHHLNYWFDSGESRESLLEKLKRHGYDVYYESVEITVGPITEPVFMEETEEISAIIDEIIDAYVYNTKFWYAVDMYTKYSLYEGQKIILYVHKIIDGKEIVPVVICTPDDREYLQEYFIGFGSEKHRLAGGGKTKLVEYDIEIYQAEQYKKNSYIREITLL
jgi:hypothetical protein